MRDDKFINVDFTNENIDSYYVRTSILNAIRNFLPEFKGVLLDVGCGKMPYKDYILQHSRVDKYVGLDIENALRYDDFIQPDFTWDGIVMPFDDNLFESSFATEVLEHCPDPAVILSEIVRVLKPNGIFFFTVPFLWPLHEVPHDEFRYTPFSLSRLLKNSGFRTIKIEALGGWHASMAQLLGLWVKRAPLGRLKRKWLLLIIKPVMNYLIRKDKYISVEFKESQMITGFYGIAYK